MTHAVGTMWAGSLVSSERFTASRRNARVDASLAGAAGQIDAVRRQQAADAPPAVPAGEANPTGDNVLPLALDA